MSSARAGPVAAAVGVPAVGTAALAGAAPGRRVTVLTTVDEVRALASQWEAMDPPPGADPDAFLALVRCRATVRAPWVVAQFRDDELEALLVARLEEHTFRGRFACHTLFRRQVRSLTFEYRGALRRHPSTPWGPLVRRVAEALRAGEADVAYFRRIDEHAELLDEVRAALPRPWRNESEAPEAHWCLDLPDDFEALLARVSGRTRQTLRRARRHLERSFPGGLIVRRTTAAADVPGFCRRAETVARETYQRGLDAGFVHDAETEARLVAAAGKGQLRAYEIEVAGRCRAFWIGEVAGGTHHLDATGHAADFARWSPGKVLRLEVLRDAIAEGTRRLDFGFGDAEYKRQFGARSWRERDVYLFAPGLRGACLNAARGGVVWSWRLARAAVERARIGAALRRLTRRIALRRVTG